MIFSCLRHPVRRGHHGDGGPERWSTGNSAWVSLKTECGEEPGETAVKISDGACVMAHGGLFWVLEIIHSGDAQGRCLEPEKPFFQGGEIVPWKEGKGEL